MSLGLPRCAVLFSGHLRTFAQCWPTIRWHVLRHYPEAHLFFSLVLPEDGQPLPFEVPGWDPERVRVEWVRQPVFDDAALAAHAVHAPYAISVPPRAIVGQLWHLWRVWEFCREQSPEHQFDYFIRCRPDLWFHDLRDPGFFSGVARVPWWGRFGGVNDRFAMLDGGEVAAAYFGTFGHLHSLLASGCPLHPESLVRASLERAGVRIDDRLDAVFSTLREDGTSRPPEILSTDFFRRSP